MSVAVVIGVGGFMIKNTKCSRGAKHPRRLRTVLRLTITSYGRKKTPKKPPKNPQKNEGKKENEGKKGETNSIKHALLDRTFREECYNEFVPGLPP